MKIQIVSDLGPPLFGGAETYVTNLGKALAGAGNEIYWNYMKFSSSKYREKTENINLRKVWVPFSETSISFSRLLYPLFMFPQVLKTSKNADVVQFNSFPAAVTGWLAGKISRKPYLVMIHEFFRDLWGNVGRNFLERTFYSKIEELIAKFPYPQVICPSEYTKHTLSELGVDEKIINVIYHGVDHSLFHPGYEPLIKNEFVNKHIIGWSGRIGLSVTKNLKTLLEAYKILKEEVPNSILLFGGSDFSNLIPEIKRLGLNLEKEVFYRGEVSKDKLPYFYSSCDIFALPSLSEGFGFSALEAQACGTPVVGFEKGALPEIVKNGETGIIMKDATAESLADGLIKILNDDNLKNKLRKNGPQWAQNFTWEKSADKHLEVYKNVCGK